MVYPCLYGPNEAGKSNLPRVVRGLSSYREIEGDLLFKGRSIKDSFIQERGGFGIVFAGKELVR